MWVGRGEGERASETGNLANFISGRKIGPSVSKPLKKAMVSSGPKGLVGGDGHSKNKGGGTALGVWSKLPNSNKSRKGGDHWRRKEWRVARGGDL